MASLDVYNWEKKKVGTVEVSSEVVEAPVRKDILHALVRCQLMSRRSGTHKAKTRGEVSGGGKKPFKQKGTGNARQGSIRSPLLVGGGIIFPPQPRSYERRLPRKMNQLGLRSALSYLNKEGRLFVLDNIDSEAGKTKEFSARLKAFGAKKAVLVGEGKNDLVRRATRNLSGIVYYGTEGINVYDLLKYNHVLLAKGSLEQIERRCGVRS